MWLVARENKKKKRKLEELMEENSIKKTLRERKVEGKMIKMVMDMIR